MRKYSLFLLAVALAAPGQASADWIRERLTESCSAGSADAIANGARNNLENAVSRAEAAIEPPIPVGDLSCLGDLMEAPLDVFSGAFTIPDITNLFQGTLDSVLEGPGGVSRQICQFAADQWAEVTQPITDVAGTLSSFSSNFGNFNLPGGSGGSGGSAGTTQSGSAGTSGTTRTPRLWQPTQRETVNLATGSWVQSDDGLWYDANSGRAYNPARWNQGVNQLSETESVVFWQDTTSGELYYPEFGTYYRDGVLQGNFAPNQIFPDGGSFLPDWVAPSSTSSTTATRSASSATTSSGSAAPSQEGAGGIWNNLIGNGN